MQKTKLYYTGSNGLPGWCWLVWDAEVKLAIVSEDQANTGQSVTNAAAEIATAVCRAHQVPPEELILVEHYGPESYANQSVPHHFCRIEFGQLVPEIAAPNFKHIKEADPFFQLCTDSLTNEER